jgi:hypothetical protein
MHQIRSNLCLREHVIVNFDLNRIKEHYLRGKQDGLCKMRKSSIIGDSD